MIRALSKAASWIWKRMVPDNRPGRGCTRAHVACAPAADIHNDHVNRVKRGMLSGTHLTA